MKKIIRYVLNHVPRKTIQRFVHTLLPVAGVLYAGRRVECPVCGHKYRKFLPYGYVKVRENALCPSCLSLERHRLLWIYLQRETRFFDGVGDVLHIAPERCFIERFAKIEGNEYVTADLESPLARIKMDIQNIQYPDCRFDVIICNHILEHVDDDRLAMSELFRVMRSGGWGIVLSPVNPRRATTYEDRSIVTPEARSEAYGQRDHLRDYGLDFADRLVEAGFEVDAVDYAATLSAEERRGYGLLNDIVFVVRKPLS